MKSENSFFKVKYYDNDEQELEIIFAFKQAMKTNVIVKTPNGEFERFILSKKIFKNNQAEKIYDKIDDEFMRELAKKEVEETFFLGLIEATMLNVDKVKEKFGNRTYDIKNELFNSFIKFQKQIK